MLKNRCPYVDAALWTPFGERFQEKLHFTGNFLSAEGKIVKIRVSGPADFKQWLECWTILKMVLMGFDQVDDALKPNGFLKVPNLVDVQSFPGICG